MDCRLFHPTRTATRKFFQWWLAARSGRQTRRHAACLLGWTTILAAAPAAAITPDHPLIKERVAKAIRFLENADENRLGGKALVGLTLAKSGAPQSHPKIQEAIHLIQAALRDGPQKFNADIYSTGISIMFLTAVDPSRYRYEIETLVASLHLRQKTDGAWGYPESNKDHGTTCDTSMTQYAVLGLWEAEDQAGVETPPQVWDRVAHWLIGTQDPSGGFGYQGKPAARLGKNEPQSGVKHSFTAAAVGSLYVVKDRVGIRKLKKRTQDDTPEVFEPYESAAERDKRIKTNVDLRLFSQAIADGNRWIEKNYKVDQLGDWVQYSLYALERFETFKEADEAGANATEVEKTDRWKWYNQGARYLLQTQKEDGSWQSTGGPVPDTCFAALFLMGSTRKTLSRSSAAHYEAGLLIGGRDLPASRAVRLRDGYVVQQPLDAPLEQVLAILAEHNHPQFARAVESLADAAGSGDPQQLRHSGAALTRLALNGPGGVRLLALRALERTKDIANAPLFIYFLRDRDPELALAAHGALESLSRQTSNLKLDPVPTSEQRRRAAEHWKSWFRTIRPDIDLDTWNPAAGLP